MDFSPSVNDKFFDSKACILDFSVFIITQTRVVSRYLTHMYWMTDCMNEKLNILIPNLSVASWDNREPRGKEQKKKMGREPAP